MQTPEEFYETARARDARAFLTGLTMDDARKMRAATARTRASKGYSAPPSAHG